METFDWHKIIRTNIFCLRLIGLWPQGDGTYEKNLYTLYSVIFLVLVLCGHNLCQTINIFFVLNDLEAFSTTFLVNLTCAGGVLKAYSIVRNMRTIKQLFATLRNDIFQPRNIHQIELIQPGIRMWRRIFTLLMVTGANCGFFWATYPILGKSKYKLPLLAWFPFETKISPNFELTYCYQVAFTWMSVMVNVHVDTLIAALNMFIGGQCEILCDNLRNLSKTGIVKDFYACIQHHKAILDFSNKCNKVYNWILLLQFLTSAVTIGFSMFRLTQVPPFSSEFYTLVAYGNAILVQIFFHCWFGNEVEIKSNRIPYSLFQSNWIEAPEIHKTAIIFSIRTQKCIKLSALNLFYLTLETFKTILRSAYSYFAVLHQVNS